MAILHYEVILYVTDQQKSRDFYSIVLQMAPTLDLAGMTEYTLGNFLKIGLMPADGIAKILNKMPHPSTGSTIPRCELYLQVDDIEGAVESALQAGARLVSGIANRDWGDKVAYLADFDAHIIAFAKPIIQPTNTITNEL